MRMMVNGVEEDVPGFSYPSPTVDDRRSALSAQRYDREVAGVMFQASGVAAPALLGTGREDQNKINAAYAMATNGHWVDGTPWKMVDGTFQPMTSADIQTAAVKAATYVARCYAREAQLAAELVANPLTDITQGWPSNV